MLVGLFVTFKWIPGQEHGLEGKVKTLEELEVGRETPNNFATTRIAKVVEKIWKFLAKVTDSLYMALDRLAGGDEKERREQEKQRLQMEEEMQEMQEEQDQQRIDTEMEDEGQEENEERVKTARAASRGTAEGNETRL